LKRANNSDDRRKNEVLSTVGESVVYTIVIKPDEHMVYGAEGISKIVKRNPNEIPALVRDFGLKAWQDGAKGKWRALCSDLLEFNRLEKERNLSTCQ